MLNEMLLLGLSMFQVFEIRNLKLILKTLQCFWRVEDQDCLEIKWSLRFFGDCNIARIVRAVLKGNLVKMVKVIFNLAKKYAR